MLAEMEPAKLMLIIRTVQHQLQIQRHVTENMCLRCNHYAIPKVSVLRAANNNGTQATTW